jgi:hypothetical protein
MKIPSIMKQIEKLAKGHQSQKQRELKEVEKMRERFERACDKKEARIEQVFDARGAKLENRIKEIAEKNGMLCFIGCTNTSVEYNRLFWNPLKSIGGLDLPRPSGKRGRIAILPAGSQEKALPDCSKGTWLIGPKGEILIHKSELGLSESE